jgi:hypothetical protein
MNLPLMLLYISYPWLLSSKDPYRGSDQAQTKSNVSPRRTQCTEKLPTSLLPPRHRCFRTEPFLTPSFLSSQYPFSSVHIIPFHLSSPFFLFLPFSLSFLFQSFLLLSSSSVLPFFSFPSFLLFYFPFYSIPFFSFPFLIF